MRRLIPCARGYGLLEWIALEVRHGGHELGLDSGEREARGSFGRDREIHLPVLVAHCRRARAGIVEEDVARGFLRIAGQIVELVDAVELRLDDTRVAALLDLVILRVAVRPGPVFVGRS